MHPDSCLYYPNQCCLIRFLSILEWIDVRISCSASAALASHVSDFDGFVMLSQSATPLHTRYSCISLST